MTTKAKEKVVIPGLDKGDFYDPTPLRNRLIWSVYGETKSGKSSFATAGDGDSAAVVFDYDRRVEGVTSECKRPIKEFKGQFPKVDPMSRKADETVRKAANAEWDRFLRHFDMTLKSSMLDGGVGRIVIDTATELFDLRLMAEFGRLMGINPRDRGGANAEFVEIMRRGEQYNANVVWLHHSKPEWKNVVDDNGKEKSMTTGNVVLDGFNKANSVVQVVAKTCFNEGARDPRKRFEVEIVRCGVNSSVNRMKFTSADWAVWDEDADKDAPPVLNYGPLAYISSIIKPDTEPEEWM